jgi:predicted transcriptional regulator of viral defense system
VANVKYVKEFLKYFEPFPAFTAKDVKLFLRKNGAGSSYYKIFMHNIVKGGKVFSIGRGRYTLHDDPMIAGFIFSPFYYGLETALTYYKLWDYVTPISIVTTNRIRKSRIVLLGRNATVRKIKRKNFFGYSMVYYKDNLYIPMADIEKTLIDSVYFHSRFSKGIYITMTKRIDRKKLGRYLKHYNSIVKKQVVDLIRTRNNPSGRGVH